MADTLDVRADRDIRSRKIELAFALINKEEGYHQYPTKVTWERCDDGSMSIGSGDHTNGRFRLEFEKAAILMTELWNCGIRPQGIDFAAEAKDLKAHLSDMRKLAFHLASNVVVSPNAKTRVIRPDNGGEDEESPF